MYMTRLERFHLLSYFGSGQAVPYVQVIQIGSLYLANPSTKVHYDIRITKKEGGKAYYQFEMERMLKKALEDCLVMRVDNERTKAIRLLPEYQISHFDWSYKITPKGRECLGNEQIERAGDYSWYNANSGFKGTIDSAAKINPNLFK